MMKDTDMSIRSSQNNMKKIILSLIIMVCSLSMFAQTTYYRTTECRYKKTSEKWGSWAPSKIPVSIDYTIGSIEFFDEPTRSYNLYELKERKYATSTIFSCRATDQDDKILNIYFTCYNNGTFIITFEYKNVQVAYKLEELELETYVQQ